MKHRDRPSLRLSPELQAVVEAAGDSSAAMRALLILGAAVAGYDVTPLHHEALRLQGDLAIDWMVLRALANVSDTRQTDVRHVSDTPAGGVAEVAPLDDDPFAGVGFEV